MPDMPCPGACNTAWRKAWRRWDAGYHVAAVRALVLVHLAIRVVRPGGAPLLVQLLDLDLFPPDEPLSARPRVGDPVWCTRCTAEIRTALAQLDDLAAVLAANADGHRGAGPATGTRGGRAGSRSPSPAVDELDELYDHLAAIEDHWREYRGYPARPYRGRGAHARTATIAWLMQQLSVILMHPASVDVGLGILGWQRRLQRATASTPEVRRRQVRCPRCTRLALRGRDDGYTECARCGLLLAQHEVDELIQSHGGAA